MIVVLAVKEGGIDRVCANSFLMQLYSIISIPTMTREGAQA